MRNTLLGLALAASLAPLATQAQQAAASPHSFTGNVTLASEYLYRGIAQTRGKPAIQGGFDYGHASGLYVGVWASNISWIGDTVGGASAPIEIDVYGGYKGTITGDLGFDVGVLTYNYPGTNKTGNGAVLKQDTTEVYGALSWKWLTLKYSHSTTALFGWNKVPVGATLEKTKGSGYLELNAAYDLGQGWGLAGHVGHQKVKGYSDASYTDYKLGVTKDMGFGVLGLAYSDTNAKDNCATGGVTNPYCQVMNTTGAGYEAGKGRVVLSFAKSF